MALIAALIYWVIIALWLVVFVTISMAFARSPRTFGAARLLLAVVSIDAFRNIFENTYFGMYFGAKYGLFPHVLDDVLGSPHLLIVPKLINVGAACLVLGLLALRWLPTAEKERAKADADVRTTSDALEREIEEHHMLFETSVDLIIVMDQEQVIRRISASCLPILGFPSGDLVGRRACEIVGGGDVENFRETVGEVAQGHGSRSCQVGFDHKDGRVIPLGLTVVWSDQVERFFVTGRDMTERHEAEANLTRLAHFDQLTGLPNRRSLREDLRVLLDPGGSRPGSIAVTVFDLDGFKHINDTLGHSTGDQLLAEVGRRFAEMPARCGRAYRLGGDEFVLVLPDCGDPLVSTEIVHSVLARLYERFEINGKQLFLGASAGTAISGLHGSQDIDELVANADLALYDAKAAGGRRCRLFAPTLRAKAEARQETETQLRRAFSDREFVLFFQPQIDLKNGAVVGAEALLRWQHPKHGLVEPGAFIDTLSQSAVVSDVGRWILQTACEAAAAWRAGNLDPIRMSVNLFPAQVHDGSLVRDVETVLRRTGLPAHALELEITENIALNGEEATLAALRAVRSAGVGLALDDFGTGYASLNYLTRYPLTRIKIDRAFVGQIAEGATAKDTAVVRSIIQMAHNLHLEVIAEGVENAYQAAFLAEQRCAEVQGYLYGRPVPAKLFERVLRRQSFPALEGKAPSLTLLGG